MMGAAYRGRNSVSTHILYPLIQFPPGSVSVDVPSHESTQLEGIERLLDKLVEALGEQLRPPGPVRGEGDHRNSESARVRGGLHRADQLDAVVRHGNIAHHHFWTLFVEQ